ncbi:MAG: hypothetical protein QOJ54_2851 [Aliidongia sp.]|jgi:hypothetical protein|nr:hypothetical protein [Aliidongia sp.]
MSATPVTFAADIQGMLFKYRGQMMWRLDLADYADVKANAAIIYSLIASDPAQMPPPPFPPFPTTFIAAFKAWMDQDYPP